MYRRILVPLDGSRCAESALPLAACLARRAAGNITLVRAVSIPSVVSAYSSWIEHDRIEASVYLTRLADTPELSGIAVDTHVLLGAPGAAILDTAEARRADLIIICSHGRSGAARWLLGSVAQQVARHATVPVLVLRVADKVPLARPADDRQSYRVLVPLDGSALAEAALEPAAAWLAALAVPDPTLHLALVLAPYEGDKNNMPEALAGEGARAYLSQVADRLRAAHPHLAITWTVMASLDVAEALIHAAEAGDRDSGGAPVGRCDVMAMATHGRIGAMRWALGSVTERVLHGTTLPLLIVRPPQPAKSPAAVVHHSVAVAERRQTGVS